MIVFLHLDCGRHRPEFNTGGCVGVLAVFAAREHLTHGVVRVRRTRFSVEAVLHFPRRADVSPAKSRLPLKGYVVGRVLRARHGRGAPLSIRNYSRASRIPAEPSKTLQGVRSSLKDQGKIETP